MPHPLHPAIVHFPIVMLLLGAVCQIIAMRKPDFFQRAAICCFAIGFLGGVAAYLTGDDGMRLAVQSFGASPAMINTHETFAKLTLLAAGAYLAVSALRLLRPGIRMLLPALLILSLISAALVTVTGHYGGQLVYAKANAQTPSGHGHWFGDDDHD